MDREAFIHRLTQLPKYVTAAHSSAATWRVSYGANQEEMDLMNRYREFFTPALVSLQYMMLMEVAKLFDRSSNTVNIPSLLNAALKDPSLLPYVDLDQLKQLRRELSALQPCIARLRTLRDQALAHNEANPDDLGGFLRGDLDAILDFPNRAMNALTLGYDRSMTSLSGFPHQAESVFEGMLEARREHRTRNRALIDETRQP